MRSLYDNFAFSTRDFRWAWKWKRLRVSPLFYIYFLSFCYIHHRRLKIHKRLELRCLWCCNSCLCLEMERRVNGWKNHSYLKNHLWFFLSVYNQLSGFLSLSVSLSLSLLFFRFYTFISFDQVVTPALIIFFWSTPSIFKSSNSKKLNTDFDVVALPYK